MIEIQLEPGEPEYAQIAHQIRLAVAAGQLQQGDRLDPVRVLARRLGVNASTVARAYRLLEMQRIIETHGRRGSLVSTGHDLSALREMRQMRLRAVMEHTVVEALSQGFSPDEVEAAFSLQLGAWRERRREPSPAVQPVEASQRLARFAGSHDLALEALWAQARRVRPDLSFSVSYVGSLDGLLQLLHGEVGLAGTHMLDQETGEYNLPILRRLFVGQQLCVITLAEREQGLILAPGNPLGVHSLSDIAGRDIRFINRQTGSGTRALFDYHLQRLGIPAQAVQGYDVECATHLAVAAEIARGKVDVGLGLRAAARAFGLDFVPLARERYDLVMFAEDRNQAPLNRLLDLVTSAEFKAVMERMAGYDTTRSGTEVYL